MERMIIPKHLGDNLNASGETTDETTAVYADYERDPATGEVFTVTRTVPAAPERGEHNDKMYSKSSRQTKQHIHTCMFCGQSGTELNSEQHSTLIAQRERLIKILQAACSTLKSYQYGNVSPELAKEMIRMIEQVLTTSEQEGRGDESDDR